MPITIDDIKAHKEQFSLGDIDTMHTADYRKSLEDGAFFWIDHHEFVRSTFSGEIFATNCEQLDVMIAHLLKYRDIMPILPKWMSGK